MNEDIAWGYLSNIPVGTIVSWIFLIAIIIGILSAVVIKLYKLFEKAKKVQDDNTFFKEMLQNHEDTMKFVTEELKCIRAEQQESKKRELKRLRHSIIRAGEEAITDNRITIRKLKSLEELYEEYTNFKDSNGKPANGYVRSLMSKVRVVNVVGKLDENDEDIE